MSRLSAEARLVLAILCVFVAIGLLADFVGTVAPQRPPHSAGR